MLSSVRIVGHRWPVFLAAIVVAVLVGACGAGSATSGAAAPAATSAPAPGGLSGNPSEGEGDGAGSPGSGTGSGRNLVVGGPQDQLIIKNGSLVLQVPDIDGGLAAATDKIKGLGGYVSGSRRSGDGESDQATITFRIPAANWEGALAALRGIATKVLGEDSTTDDVTTQVVDLGARIKNLQATETALQGIMDRATEIKDVLAVQAELTTVRGQIEQMTAEKQSLEGQAAYSTLAVTFSLKPDPVLTSKSQFDPKTEVDQASASLVSVLQGLATAGIWFAIVWLPILIAIGVLIAIGLYIYRRVRPTAILPPAAPAATGDPTG
jgi:hypothetical protein